MTVSPIPCKHCGVHFMRLNLSEEASRLCNSCELKENIRKQKEASKMKPDKVKMLIEVDRAMQIEVEEECTNKGISISKYFIDLHTLNKSQGWEPKTSWIAKELHIEKEYNDGIPIRNTPPKGRGKK